MKVKLCFIDRNYDAHSFIATQILAALNTECEVVVIKDKTEIMEVLSDNKNIIIVNYSNDIIQGEEFVDMVMKEQYQATLMCTAENDRELFRFLPARPFALLRGSDFETDLTSNLKEAVKKLKGENEEKLVFKIKSGEIRVLPSEISYLKDGILYLTTNESYEVSDSGSALKNILSGDCFEWINKHCAVNINNVKSISDNGIA